MDLHSDLTKPVRYNRAYGTYQQDGLVGKLVAAGPILDDGDLRGIFLFKVSSVEEAKASRLQDPAVKAGRLAFEVLPGWALEILERSFRRPTVSIRIQNRL